MREDNQLTVLPALDPMLQIARGVYPGFAHVNQIGRNPDCDQAASTTAVEVGRDVWDLGIAGADVWVPPTAARVHNLASSNDEDGGAGTDTGALTAKVYGLDGDFALLEDTVTLNGTTDAPTAVAFAMIYRIECLTFGSAGRNLGNIAATAVTDATVTARVTTDMSESLSAIYQVPAAKTGYVTGWHGRINHTGGTGIFADFFLMGKKDGGGWRVLDIGAAAIDGELNFASNRKPFRALEAKELVKVVAEPSADAQDISAGFDIIIVDD